MTKHDRNHNRSADLRQQAEEQLRQHPSRAHDDSPGEAGHLLYELQVHQIELEMQNEELRRTQAELEASRVRYVDLWNLAPVGYLTISKDGLILEANRSAAVLLGVTKRGLVQKPLLHFIAKEDHDLLLLHCQKLFATGSPQVCELRMVKKDRATVWVRIAGSAATDNEGARTWQAVLSDITAQKQAQEALHDSNLHLQLITENMLDMVSRVTMSGIRVYVSPAHQRVLGYKPEDMIGTSVVDYVHPDDMERVSAAVQSALRSLHAQRVEFRSRHADGHYVWLETIGKALFDNNGSPIGGVLSSRDISERKQVEQTLFEEQNLLRMLMCNLPDAIYFKDSQGRFIRMSQGHASAFGLSDPALAIGKTDFDFFTEDHARQALADEQAIMATGEPLIDVEERDTHLDGRVIWVSTTKMPLRDQDGRIIGTFGVSRDITQRKRAEEQITRQLQHMSALHEIDMTITAATDVQLVLNAVLKHAMNQLGVDAATILLMDANTQRLEYAVGRGFHSSALQHTRLQLGDGYAGQAALEGSVIQVSNLIAAPDGLTRSPLLAAEGFVFYCAAPLKSKGHVVGVLEVFHRSPVNADQEWLEFLEAISTQAAIAVDSAQLFDRLQRSNMELSLAYDATIEGWSCALDLRDKLTEGHTQRGAKMAIQLARVMGVDDAALVHMWRGALLHDMGKIGIPDSILLKPGQLSEDEWTIMRQHPQIAYDLLAPIAYLQPALDIPYCHHEKWDGTGYPRGLKGEQIPLPARIFAVIDVFDALTSDRPYRAAWSRKKALAYIREQSGKHFDPQAVAAFLSQVGHDGLS